MEYGLGAQDNSSQKYSGDPELRKVRNHARWVVFLYVCLSICLLCVVELDCI